MRLYPVTIRDRRGVSPAERSLWLRVQQRAQSQSPDLARAILKAFQNIRDSLSDAEILRIVASGASERLIQQAITNALLDQSMAPVRETIRRQVVDNARYFRRDLPTPTKTIGIVFDTLNPRVIDAVHTLETRVITSLSSDVRETFRAHVENGIRDGHNPRVIARDVRGLIGLAPNQEEAVRNFRRALEGIEGARNPLEYKLRDKRFDGTIKKGNYTAKQVETMTDAYRQKMLAFNAETNSRTATLDALKLGQQLSVEDAIEKGILDRRRMVKTWVGVLDSRERPEHVKMEGETVSYDETYTNGQMIPGDDEYNCRCISRFHQKAA